MKTVKPRASQHHHLPVDRGSTALDQGMASNRDRVVKKARPSLSCLRIGVGSMKSPVAKRSLIFGGRKTSVSLEDAFWQGLREIAQLG